MTVAAVATIEAMTATSRDRRAVATARKWAQAPNFYVEARGFREGYLGWTSGSGRVATSWR
jgi:hypothetical protein